MVQSKHIRLDGVYHCNVDTKANYPLLFRKDYFSSKTLTNVAVFPVNLRSPSHRAHFLAIFATENLRMSAVRLRPNNYSFAIVAHRNLR